jgi:hypothetical protein
MTPRIDEKPDSRVPQRVCVTSRYFFPFGFPREEKGKTSMERGFAVHGKRKSERNVEQSTHTCSLFP